MLDLADIYGERKFASALDSALYHCLDDGTQEKYLAALHKQARARSLELGLQQSSGKHAMAMSLIDTQIHEVQARRGALPGRREKVHKL